MFRVLWLTLRFRQTRSRVTLVLVLSLLELMVASQSVDMFLLMLPLLVCSFGRVVVMRELPRFRIPLVSTSIYFGAYHCSDSF
jgi:hypothetical protein